VLLNVGSGGTEVCTALVQAARGCPARVGRDLRAVPRGRRRLPRADHHSRPPLRALAGRAIAIATHKANVFIDLSGWSPQYFPPQLVHAAGRMLKHKVLFGSDYPLITPDRWLADFSSSTCPPTCDPPDPQDNAGPRSRGL